MTPEFFSDEPLVHPDAPRPYATSGYLRVLRAPGPITGVLIDELSRAADSHWSLLPVADIGHISESNL